MKDIQLIDIDYSGSDTTYKREETVDLSKISGYWIVPEEGPFYKDSLRVLKGGLDIDSDKFKAQTEVTDLTELTGRGVCLYIELTDDVIASKGELTIIYQKVGKPVISVKTLLQALEDMIITGKPVDWETQIEGKPKSVWTAQHSHDIQNKNEMIGFGGLCELFTLFTNTQITDSGRAVELLTKLQTDMYDRLDYIQKLKWGVIMGHARNYENPHEIIPADVDLDKVANCATATVQEDGEGNRSDLYSTSAGLKRLIAQTNPVTEGYLLQSELPFGYYGSGIYLPPPITGSFEGLGGDIENSAFCQEGNGWCVGLIRAYDGRVKNLYYIYTTEVAERSTEFTWEHTYVQYQHPTITAAGKKPNVVISGSGNEVLMVGSVGNIENNQAPSVFNNSFWVSEANSTFDPDSHQMKPVDMSALVTAGLSTRPGAWTLAPVGDWVYLIVSYDSFSGDAAGNYNSSMNVTNWQQATYRFPRQDLTDTSKTSITLTRVNVTFDNFLKERRTNQPSLFFGRHVMNANGKLTACYTKYATPLSNVYSWRRRAFIIVPNKNNKRLARVKILLEQFQVDYDATGTQILYRNVMSVDYNWDVVSNIWTVSSLWEIPTANIDGTITWPSTNAKLQSSIDGEQAGVIYRYANACASWISGLGYVTLGSLVTGQPPYVINVTILNPWGDINRDYEALALPINQYTEQGQLNTYTKKLLMKSPFGVAGFPRHYADLYAMKSQTRQYPIEIFIAENENQETKAFYRITEGGTDDGYDYRESIQSDYISTPIYGRKTNSKFGKVLGLDYSTPYTNRPGRKDASSRESGIFKWKRKRINSSPGAPFEFGFTTKGDGTVGLMTPESDGSILLNLTLDYELDTISNIITCKPNPSKQLRIPRSIYVDLVNTVLGSHASTLIDISCDFYFAGTPGGGADVPPSMFSIMYHLTGSPSDVRMIIGVFDWTVASTGADGIRIPKLGTITYPFKQGSNSLAPNTNANIAGSKLYQLVDNLYWDEIPFGWVVSRQHQLEILDVGTGGRNNMQMVHQTDSSFRTPGNQALPTLFYNVTNGAVTRAEVEFLAIGPFNEYINVYRANTQWGWLKGVGGAVSGGAMDLMRTSDGSKYIMYGATYVEGNWLLFISSEVGATFNGYGTKAPITNWDLRDLTDVYKNQTFYIYCVLNGSSAIYEVTKVLRNHSATQALIAIVKTDDLGIVTVEKIQNFTIAGFPLTRSRDMGVPVSSGAVTEQGTYKFLSRSELYDN